MPRCRPWGLRAGLSAAGPGPPACGPAAWARRAPTAPAAARTGAAPPRSPSPQEKSGQSTALRVYNRPSGHLRTWVLQPAGLHRGQPVPSLPPAAGRVTPLCYAPTGRSGLPLRLLLLREGARVLGKSRERKRRIRTGQAKAARALRGQAGCGPRSRPSAPAGGWPSRAGSPRTLSRGHGPAPVPSPLLGGLMSFCQGIVWSEFQLYVAKSLCELSLWMKILRSGYCTATFLRSNSLGQYIL